MFGWRWGGHQSYGRQLPGMLRKGDREAFLTEILPLARQKSPKGQDEDGLMTDLRRGYQSMFGTSFLKPVDPKNVELHPAGREALSPDGGLEDMIQVRPGQAPDDFEPLEIEVGKVNGTNQIVKFRN